jgi:putative Holliday junction resolvase
MRTLAIDLGSRRIGLALSDQAARLASPYDVLRVTSPARTIETILAIIQDEGVERVVVGLPLNMDGTPGPAARSTIAWAEQLKPKLESPNVVFVDERLSSFAAEQRFIDRKRAGEKLTRRRRKSQIDALAAADFLQAFLDGRLPPLELS